MAHTSTAGDPVFDEQGLAAPRTREEHLAASANPDFLHYVGLLIQLHALIAAGQGDGDEADALRDRMDNPGYALGAVAMLITEQVSIDLYTAHGDERGTAPTPTGWLAALIEAGRTGDTPRTLAILRSGAPVKSPLRTYAYCYRDLGLPDVAQVFEARLGPANG